MDPIQVVRYVFSPYLEHAVSTVHRFNSKLADRADLAVKTLRVFRSQTDIPADPIEDEIEVDETILEAARILAAIHNNDIDLATKVIDSVVDKSIPRWPSRAVAIFILMNFGLLSRGLWRDELGSNKSDHDNHNFSRSTDHDDSDHLSQATLNTSRSSSFGNLFDSLYDLWYSLLGESVQEELGRYIKGSELTDISEVSLRKAAVLITTITDAEIDAATETVEALRSVGSFRMPAEGIAFVALQRVEAILASYDDPYIDAKRDERWVVSRFQYTIRRSRHGLDFRWYTAKEYSFTL
ncbi:hypothetical protein MD484_g7896, partial [Candolleomyces efflorescens]